MTARVAKRAYLDTNVLIEYAWERTPSAPASKPNQASKLMELGLDGRFDIFISAFCIMELYEHFRDWFLLQKVIEDGFGYREFRRERKRYKLTRKEVEILESLIIEFRDNPNIFFIEFDSVPDDFFSRVTILQKNGLDCLDAFHLLTALDVGATHFVTKDGEVRSRFDKATRREIVSPPMEMTSIRGFLRGLS
jgi:predicted nucleic acid-binding protein